LDGGSARRKAATYTQNNTHTDIHAFSGIRTHDPSVRVGEGSSCLRPRGHCDRHCKLIGHNSFLFTQPKSCNEILEYCLKLIVCFYLLHDISQTLLNNISVHRSLAVYINLRRFNRIQLNSISIYLRVNLTAQWPITKWEKVNTKTKH
jgi:hypothetical protein